MKTLHLPVKGIYFDQIKAGTKTEEYRLCTMYWNKRLTGRRYDQIIITRGYPARDDASRRMTFAWKGFTIKTITHEHFGHEPAAVFAIKVEQP